MGTYTFYTIVCSVLRQTRFRLVHDLKRNIKSSLCPEICKNRFKKLFIAYPKTLNLLPTLPVYSWQTNNLNMPKYKLENNSENKTKEKVNAVAKRKVSKHHKKNKKNKKNKHHDKSEHKRQQSKKSKSKISVTKKVELVLLDLSSDDSDIVIVYDSRKSLTNLQTQSGVTELSENKNGDQTSEKDLLGIEVESKEENKTIITKIDFEKYADETVANFSVQKESHIDSCISENREHSNNFGESSSKIFKTDQDVSGSACASVDSRTTESFNTKTRPWQYTDFGEKMARSNEDDSTCERPYMMFDVLSYNVLCQEIMEEHADLYTYNNPVALDWNYRSNLLMKEFIEFNSDVLCLQEVQQSHLKPFYKNLETLGYTGLYKQRTGNKKDGVAIYFKTSTFNLVDHSTVEYYQPGVSVLNRDNVGLIVKLAPKRKPDERIIIATTHLLYNPRRHDVKLAQLQLLLAEVERFAFKGIDEGTNTHKYWPVILTGDMNMEPNSGGFRLLSSGSFQYEGLSSKTLTPDYYGYGHSLGKELVPQYLGVTDTCQHLHIVKNRCCQSSTYASESHQDDHKSQEPLLQIYNSDFKGKSKPVQEEDVNGQQHFLKNSNSQKNFNSGQLSHDLQLSSVYQHDPFSYDKSQVSTFQNGWVVVDYIFYSNDGRCDLTKSHEGNLKLVARYKLFNEQEASMVGPIPNLFSPSDHYPLAAKFALLL